MMVGLAGMGPQRRLCSSPIVDLRLALQALEAGGDAVLYSAAAPRKMDRLPRDQPVSTGHLLVRINPDLPRRFGKQANDQDLTARADDSIRFGVPTERRDETLRGLALRNCRQHLHVGSPMDRTHPFRDGSQRSHDRERCVPQKTTAIDVEPTQIGHRR